jgi:hypothetical protein
LRRSVPARSISPPARHNGSTSPARSTRRPPLWTLGEQVRAAGRLTPASRALSGDRAIASRGRRRASIAERVNGISGEQGRTLGRPTLTHQEQFTIASELYAVELARLRQLVETDIPALEREAEKAGAPYTAGRVPAR